MLSRKSAVPFEDDGNYSEDNFDDDTDAKDKVGPKPPRKSTKGRKLKRWDG